MTSYPCNKYEQITPSYLLSVKYIVFVVTPLVAIIETQISELQNVGVTAINLSYDEINVNDETEKKIKSGQYSILSGTPETWIKQEKWYHMLTSELFQKKTLIIVADEARLSDRVGWGKRSQMGQKKSDGAK